MFCISFTVLLNVIAANDRVFKKVKKREEMFKKPINSFNINNLEILVEKRTKNALNYILKTIKIRKLNPLLITFNTIFPLSL